MVNYQNGKIYQMVNGVNNKVYIGSTCQPLCKRMNGHRTFGKTLCCRTPIYLAMHEIGVEHFRILLVQNAPCDSKEELLAIEYEVAQRFHQKGVILYNATIDGRCSEDTRAKMSSSRIGKTASEATRAKLRSKVVSEATRVKLSEIRLKRGCVSYHQGSNRWSFIWRESGKSISKYFPVKKYGYDAARGLALYWQEEIYPIEREDDSELIREIRSRIEA